MPLTSPRGNFDFDLCAFDPRRGTVEHLIGESRTRREVEAVAV